MPANYTPYTYTVTGDYSWVDFVSLSISVASLGVTLAIFHIGRQLSFRQQRERVRELESKAWDVLKPIRTEGLNSKIIVMNAALYERGYDGSNKVTWRGGMFSSSELIEIVHNGVEVILSGIESYYDDRGHRTLTRTDRPAPNVAQIGHIPWKWIEDIAPEGDEYDGSAIFFVRHLAPGRRPYDYITYREGKPEPFGPNDRDYYHPVSELGVTKPRIRDWLGFYASSRQLKRIQRLSRQFSRSTN